ncbi:cupin domain-containing protein [Microbacterium sp. GXF7504]
MSSADWIERLGLQPLEGESGWWAPVFRSTVPVASELGDTTACNVIHYLLDAERPINAWHHLASDDTHMLLDGGPVEYITVDEAGAVRTTVLDAAHPVISIPAGSYKALRLLEPDSYALMGSVVTPAWTPERVRIEPPVLRDRPEWLTDDLMHALTTGFPV